MKLSRIREVPLASRALAVLFACLVPAPPALATHGGSHDPRPSGLDCKWYGSAEHEYQFSADENGNTTFIHEKGSGWSGPSDDSTCRGTVQFSYTQHDTYPDGQWSHSEGEHTVSSTYEAGWANFGPPGTFTASFPGDEPVTLVTTDSSGGEPVPYEAPGGSSAGCVVPGANTPAKRAKIQAVVITCPQIEGGSADESWTGTIRMRRAQCDRTIDTDGDDLADCTEFSLQTEPQNPDTDGDALTDGEEVLTHGTDPRDPDSDDGGVEDGDEVALGTDPLDPTDDPETDCNDGSSNDFDGLADYPVDPGCTSAADGSELGNVECDNGADDDEDGSTDWPADDTCLDATGETETATCELDPQAPTEEDIVRCYAPEVRLHPNERYFPMDIRTFIRRSSLNWAHDKGCADHQIAEQGGIDLIKLGEGDYRHEQKRIGCATHYGERYRSTAYTRPGDEEKAEGLAPREGFYLDLDNDDWKGLRPLSSGEGPTLYYTYRPASSGEAGYITYWFMYGYNRPPLQDVVPHAVDPHEGEWERISVQIDEHGNAERVAYYQHYCDPGLSGQIFDWGELVGQGSVTRETHPVVYSGLGGHASQPSAGTFDGKDYCEMPSTASSAVRTFGHLFTDRTAEGGAVWKTWLRLKDIEQEPWYEFGGAFGDTVSTSALEGNFTALKQLFMYANQTGPLGPPHKSPFAPYGFGP